MTRRASQNFLALNVHQRLTFSLSRSSSAIPSISSDREPPTHIIFAMSCTSMSLLSKKSAKPRVERSPSIESCFPARSSAETSGCKSPEDNDISINMEHSHEDIYHEDSTCLDKFDNGISPASYSVKYPIASAVPPEISIPCPSISDFQNSPQQLQNVMNLTTIVEMTGSDAQSIPSSSRRLDSPGYPLMSQSASFPLATVAFSGAISGEVRANGLRAYVILFLAALKGDWQKAKDFLLSHPQAVSARITRGSETALHIAAGARHTGFVEELVNLMTSDDLALQNKVGNTALCFAAASGVTRIAEVMVNKNEKLPLIRGSKGALPLYVAALLGHRDMVWYLYSITKEDLTDEDLIGLLIAAITANLFDVALDMIQRYPGLAISRDGNGDTALHVLSRKPAAFFSGSQLGLWQRCIYSCLHVDVPSNYLSSYKRHRKLTYPLSHVVPFLKVLLWKVLSFLVPGLKVIYDKKLMQIQALELVKRLWSQVLLLNDSKIGELIRTPSRLLFTAAELGIVEFVVVLIQSYPDLIWKVDDKSQSIFHIAVAHRQENIFNLIYEIGAHKDLIAAYKDENNNNMLHLAGKLAPPNRLKTDSGAALQLRRELHWFKEVEKIVQPLYTEMRDSEGRTPQFLFTEGHKGLVYEGEKWMKDTASSCMVVATLIATVMFAAAFSVPGGNNDNTGRPIFISKKPFMVFAISDALALFSSATSILMFLSILTSRYAEEDFLDSLPNRLIMGLATLFISIATMMISFCATFFIVLSQGLEWIGVPMALVACVPVILFALLQFPLFVDVISHTYRSSTIFGPRNYLLC
ncbi:ankyrin repeat-containing protein At5g02620-like isoform X1 [Cornus florida]|uniref:ankyrin repeat-containing protein At5g02620-like isoform X1 n=1 Tax=Cornus florida TaxID=4283 RepID=UPI002897BFFE|nr:ankyrin repeat-containing protein At5g02620-like isoform X1 [Cornus florida]